MRYFQYFILMALIAMVGCKSDNTNPSNPPNSTNLNKTDLKYLALGDSYTIGESVELPERFPVQLGKVMDAALQANTTVKIIAKTGWTTDELMAGIELDPPDPPYDLVTLLIGVNNQYRGRDLMEYRFQFNELLAKAIEFAGDDPDRVIVISIPDYGVTPFASGMDAEKIRKEIDEFNQVNQEISLNMGISWVNVTGISRMAAQDLSLLAEDGLHPSGEMYSMWVDELWPVVLQKFE
jgi:lysophospholipase L1-like esterase